MKYLLLEKSSIHKEIKCYPQCKGVPDGFNFTMYDKPNSITNLDNDFFPDFDPEIIVQSLILERKQHSRCQIRSYINRIPLHRFRSNQNTDDSAFRHKTGLFDLYALPSENSIFDG